MSQAEPASWRVLGWFAAAIAIPVLIVTLVEFIVENSEPGDGQWYFFVGLAFAVLAGVACVWRLPFSFGIRLTCAIVYVLLMTPVLLLYAVGFGFIIHSGPLA